MGRRTRHTAPDQCDTCGILPRSGSGVNEGWRSERCVGGPTTILLRAGRSQPVVMRLGTSTTGVPAPPWSTGPAVTHTQLRDPTTDRPGVTLSPMAAQHPEQHPPRIEPGPGQESVWDYPRPPRLDPSDEHVVVKHSGVVVADTTRSYRVLETSQPPAYYLPPADVDQGLLSRSTRQSVCEWKGLATYYDVVVVDRTVPAAAWTYLHPEPAFEAIAGHLAFYPQLVDECLVDGERVSPNEGAFYGGWVTSRVVGPFKGAPGTAWW